MSPLVENFLIAFFSGILTTATALQTALTAMPAGDDMISLRTWISAAVVGVVTFAGAVVNGLRQKAKDPLS